MSMISAENHGLRLATRYAVLTLIAVIAILTVLQFTPALVLGPVAEHLSLASP